MLISLLLMGSTPLADGALLSSKPCPGAPLATRAAHRVAREAHLAEERTEAEGEKIVLPPVAPSMLDYGLPSDGAARAAGRYQGFQCREIVYASGGLRIAGHLWKPIATAGKRLPLVIALRGGRATYEAMEPWRYGGFHDFLQAGYVVLSTQYRGGPGSEGADEFGGRDLDDVRALLPLARNLGYVDTDRTFLFGGSRGGMQAYMLARSGFPARAVAIRAGMADMARSFARRPTLAAPTFRMMGAATPAEREAAVAARSAVRWANEIKLPTILFHGGADWRVDPADSLAVAQGMLAAGTPVALHLYDGDTHAITFNEADMLTRTVAFFDHWGGKAR